MRLRRVVLFVVAVAVLATILTRDRWTRPPFKAPARLVIRPDDRGRVVHTATLDINGDARPALLESARYKVGMPRRALLTFALGTVWSGTGEAPGWFRVAVKVDDKVVAERQLNPRAPRGWRDVSVELTEPKAQSKVEFELRFTDRNGGPITRPPELQIGLADPTVHDLDAYGRSKVVVLVSIDTLRRDHVGTYGYEPPTTPNLDALAQQSVVFEDAVSTSSWTLPAHLSMLTSVDPKAHGGVDMATGFNHKVPTLPARLRQAGFATHGVSSHLYVSSVYGMNDGFDALDFRQDRKANEVADRAIDLIDRHGDRPLFLFLHFYDPHWHYDPPQRDLRVFEPTPYAGSLTGNWRDFSTRDEATLAPADMKHLLALYDGEIRYTDGELQRVFAHLDARGMNESTMVVVTSDHGEEFMEHGSWEHQKTLYEEVVRIPMIMRIPGVPPRREPAQVSLLDVAPTILGWVGIPAQQEGRSLLKPPGDREAYGETEQTPDGTRKIFLRGGQGRWKAIFTIPRTGVPASPSPAPGATPVPGVVAPVPDGLISEEWYDLATDAAERQNAPPPPAFAETVRNRALERSRQSATSSGPAVCLDSEQRERLAALGYVGPVQEAACPVSTVPTGTP